MVLGAGRFASFVGLRFPDARLLLKQEAAPGALPFLSSKAWHLSLGGRQAALFSFSHRQFSRLALSGRPGELPLPSLSLGGSFAPSQTHPPIVRNPKGFLPPLGVVAGFTFASSSSSSFTGCSPSRCPRGRHRWPLPPRPSSLAGSRWARSCPALSVVTPLAWLPVALPVSPAASCRRPCRLLLGQLRGYLAGSLEAAYLWRKIM